MINRNMFALSLGFEQTVNYVLVVCGFTQYNGSCSLVILPGSTRKCRKCSACGLTKKYLVWKKKLFSYLWEDVRVHTVHVLVDIYHEFWVYL